MDVCLLSFQDLMNREKRDQIPSMQVSFIDAICTQLYQVPANRRPRRRPLDRALLTVSVPLQTLAGMWQHCSPLLEGCQRNRQQWEHLAQEREEGPLNGSA